MAFRPAKLFQSVSPVVPVLLLAALIRTVYLAQYHGLVEWNLLTVDNYYHHNWAQVIAAGDIFGDTTFFRAPLYVFCLAVLYAVFGPSLWAARIFGLGVGLGSIFMTYLLGRKLFGKKTGLIAALVQALYPSMIYFEAELLLDPLFMLLFQLTVYHLLVWYTERRSDKLFTVGLLAGLAAITRPTALILVPVILLIVLWQRAHWKQTIRQAVLVVAGLSVLIGPVLLRNILVAGDPVLIASQGGINLYIGNNDEADGLSAFMPQPLGYDWRISDITYIAERDRGRELKSGEVSAYWTERAVRWIADNPVRFAGLCLKKMYFSFSDREVSNNRSLPVFFHKTPVLRLNPLSFGLIFPFAVIGALAGFARDSRIRLLLFVMGLYALTFALFFFASRFRLPLIPYYILLGVFGATVCIRHVRLKAATIPGLAVALFSLGVFAFYPLISLPTSRHTGDLSSAGLYYYNVGDYRQSLQYYRDAWLRDPHFPGAGLNVGAAYYRLGAADSARHYFELEKQEHPERADAYSNLASLYLVNGQYEAARREALAALERKPYELTPNTILVRAAAVDTTVDVDSLYRTVQAAARATHDNLYLLNEAAVFLTDRGEHAKAESLLLRAARSEPVPVEIDDLAFSRLFMTERARFVREKAKAYHQLAFLGGINGLYGQAIRYGQLAITTDPQFADAYVNLITAHAALGHLNTADSVLQVALVRFPNHSALREIRDHLQ
ncbi:MAG TPA: glycosyltransferase family 39 protein [Acidobacteriota bacterium]|nr:glycosyltransferase family 39 protein [Acidobacteriota bacterium]